jgi:hypothetical protein
LKLNKNIIFYCGNFGIASFSFLSPLPSKILRIHDRCARFHDTHDKGATGFLVDQIHPIGNTLRDEIQ